jgi:threonine/homoserine/homoserine lactone efflux protein
MMDTQSLFALLLFLLPLAYSPGPGNAFFALSGARHGLGRTTPALLGYHAATLVVTACLGSGLSFSLLTSPTISFALSTGSAVYMIWLAFGCFIAPTQTHATIAADKTVVAVPSFWAGAMVLLLNPKAYSIIFLMFSTFLKPSDDGATVLWITIIFTLNNYLAFVAWAFAGQLLSKWLYGHIANFVYGIAFIGVALWIMVGLLPT